MQQNSRISRELFWWIRSNADRASSYHFATTNGGHSIRQSNIVSPKFHLPFVWPDSKPQNSPCRTTKDKAFLSTQPTVREEYSKLPHLSYQDASCHSCDYVPSEAITPTTFTPQPTGSQLQTALLALDSESRPGHPCSSWEEVEVFLNYSLEWQFWFLFFDNLIYWKWHWCFAFTSVISDNCLRTFFQIYICCCSWPVNINTCVYVLMCMGGYHAEKHLAYLY